FLHYALPIFPHKRAGCLSLNLLKTRPEPAVRRSHKSRPTDHRPLGQARFLRFFYLPADWPPWFHLTHQWSKLASCAQTASARSERGSVHNLSFWVTRMVSTP